MEVACVGGVVAVVGVTGGGCCATGGLVVDGFGCDVVLSSTLNPPFAFTSSRILLAGCAVVVVFVFAAGAVFGAIGVVVALGASFFAEAAAAATTDAASFVFIAAVFFSLPTFSFTAVTVSLAALSTFPFAAFAAFIAGAAAPASSAMIFLGRPRFFGGSGVDDMARAVNW